MVREIVAPLLIALGLGLAFAYVTFSMREPQPWLTDILFWLREPQPWLTEILKTWALTD